VKNAPTAFGPVSFTIETNAGEKQIFVRLDPPQRRAPSHIRLVVRHPAGKPIRAAWIDDQAVDSFTEDALMIVPPKQAVSIRLGY
jgi:hypothetical protein